MIRKSMLCPIRQSTEMGGGQIRATCADFKNCLSGIGDGIWIKKYLQSFWIRYMNQKSLCHWLLKRHRKVWSVRSIVIRSSYVPYMILWMIYNSLYFNQVDILFDSQPVHQEVYLCSLIAPYTHILIIQDCEENRHKNIYIFL